ncbi:hypothetical protein [Parasitella parasitica]|uniref:Uncharacterized protein n=1 Tax=Parasitella parasitica TaxID=35722 RepID=A0A0B7NMH3_9FUNG|nr:hypothetical protein [Parasitella parasitica]
MAERTNLTDSWQNQLERLSLHDTLTRQSSQNDAHSFQHRLDKRDNPKDSAYANYDPAVTLCYRDSVSSNASSLLSRNSTISSTDTRSFSTMASSPVTNAQSPPLKLSTAWGSEHPPRHDSPNSFSPIHSLCSSPPAEPLHQENFNLTRYPSVIDPNGCFVPSKPLPFIQKTDVTRHHYVIPTFAMAGQSQAEIMKLLFNHTDSQPFAPKEEYERTIPWHIDRNHSLLTLSQYTSSGQDNPVSRNYLVGLGQRLGITTILVIVSIEVIGTVYPLLNNLVKAMETNANANANNAEQASWWSRVVLVFNQQHGISDQAAYAQRKAVLADEMPRIQERYRLAQPLSTLFVSTQVYDQIKTTEQGADYKLCSQRILWQMMEKHMLTGRWCSELLSLQNRLNSNGSNGGSLLNVLTEDDESSSSSDEAIFQTVVEYENGKVKKPEKKKKKQRKRTMLVHQQTKTPLPLQRRSTRRQLQKVHCYDGDDGSALPLPVRNHTD